MSAINSGKRLFLLKAVSGLFLISLLFFLLACSQGQKATLASPFELTDQFGELTSLSRLRGKVVVLTFLYTDCPVACPTLISKTQQAMTDLGNSAVDEVALVAVTVDPDRDTVERLREYTSSLPFNWLYLTGESGQLKVTWDNYGIYVEPQQEKMITAGETMTMKDKDTSMEGSGHAGHQGYEVIHTAKVVLIDKEGFLRAELLTTEWQVAELKDSLERLISGQEVTADFHPWRAFVSFLYRCGPVSFSSLGGAVTHSVLMLSLPVVLFGAYRLLIR